MKKYILSMVLGGAIASGLPVPSASPPGDVVGKMVVGYQAWFACRGDGSPAGGVRWVHWSSGSPPSPGNQRFELWPDVREFTNTYQTGYANLGNGRPANLFGSYDDQVIRTHFSWMQQHSIDVVALQRFGSELRDPVFKSQRDGIAVKTKDAAQASGRKYFIMYDISGWTNFATEISADWSSTIINSLQLTASSSYARQNGKPVVALWGLGFTDRPGDAATCLSVINWFKSQGCYVIGGVPSYWRASSNDSKAGFQNVYLAYDMIQPWSVGRFRDLAGANSYRNNVLAPDLAYCNSNGLDYQPVVFPGFAWSNWNGGTPNMIPRRYGTFMWHQFANIRDLGIPSVYVAMFDEFDEGTAICKAAEDSSMIPTNQYFLTLDADGVHVSSDFYLRLTGDGNRMVQGQIPLQWTPPTPHISSGYTKPPASPKNLRLIKP